MAWENLTDISTRMHMRIFGEDVTLFSSDGSSLKTKAVPSTHTTKLKEFYLDLASCALFAAVSKKDIKDPQDVTGFCLKEKNYQVIKYTVESDGLIMFYLSE